MDFIYQVNCIPTLLKELYAVFGKLIIVFLPWSSVHPLLSVRGSSPLWKVCWGTSWPEKSTWFYYYRLMSTWSLLLLIMFFRHHVMVLSHNQHAKNILTNEQIYYGNKTRQRVKSVNFTIWKCYHMTWM